MPAYDIAVTRTEDASSITYEFNYIITDSLYYACENRRYPCMFRLGAVYNDDICGTASGTAGGPRSRPYLLLPQASSAAVFGFGSTWDVSEAWDPNIANWDPAPTIKTVSYVWNGNRPSIQTMISNSTARTSKVCILTLSQAVHGYTKLACVFTSSSGSPGPFYYLVNDNFDPSCVTNYCPSYMAPHGGAFRNQELARTGDGIWIGIGSDLVMRTTDGAVYTNTQPSIETGGNLIIAAHKNYGAGSAGLEAQLNAQIQAKDGTYSTFTSAWYSMTEINVVTGVFALYQSIARPSLASAYTLTSPAITVRDKGTLAPVAPGTFTVLDFPDHALYTPLMPVANPTGLYERIWPAAYRRIDP